MATSPVNATQAVVETLSRDLLPEARSTQTVVEAMFSQRAPKAAVSQVAVESAAHYLHPEAVCSQAVIEVVVSKRSAGRPLWIASPLGTLNRSMKPLGV